MNQNWNRNTAYKICFSFLGGVFLSAILTKIITLYIKVDEELVSKYPLDMSEVRPEPWEMIGFVLFWVIYAIGFILIYHVLNRKSYSYINGMVETIAMVLTLLGTFILFTAEEDNFYIGTSYFMKWYGVLGSIIIFMVLFWISNKKSLEHLLNILSVLICVAASLFCFVRNPLFGTNAMHFNCFFTSIYNVYNGATLGVDSPIVYGTYAYLFLPIYKILGLSMNTYAFITAVMCLLILLCEYYIIKNLLSNPVIRFMALSTCIYINVFFSVHAHEEQFITQHFPMRIIFPMLMLAFITFSAKRGLLTHKTHIVIGIIICYLAFMMNLESAITTSLTWATGCFYYEVVVNKKADKKVAMHKGVSMVFISLGGIVLAFVTWVMTIEGICFFRTKHLMEISKLYLTQFIFSKVGYCMLPLPNYLHIFIFILLVYALFIGIGIQRIFYCEASFDLKNHIAFGLSVAGILMLIYYMGRTHNLSLFKWLCPCIILLAYILENIFERIKNINSKYQRIILGISGAIIFLLLSVYATSELYVLKYSESYRDFVNRQINDNYDEIFSNEIETISKYSNEGTVNYLGDYAAGVCMAAGLKNNFSGEVARCWLTWDDYDYVKNFLRSCDGYIIIDGKATEQMNKFMMEDFAQIMDEREYKIIERTSLSTIYGQSDEP